MSYLGEDIRKLGFGLMRLPQTDGVIDIEQTKEMVDLFMDAGFTSVSYTHLDVYKRQVYAGTDDGSRRQTVELETASELFANRYSKTDAKRGAGR